MRDGWGRGEDTSSRPRSRRTERIDHGIGYVVILIGVALMSAGLYLVLHP